ncbi:MAG: hypothetical protein ACP5HQ_00960 [Thermoprotei archaeon]
MKGLSAVVASIVLILVAIVSALVVVGFAFGMFNVYNINNAVTQVGVAYLTGSNGHYTLKVILDNMAAREYVIMGVAIQGVPASYVSGQVTISPSTIATYTIDVSLQGVTLKPGSTVSVVLALSNGETLHLATIYIG